MRGSSLSTIRTRIERLASGWPSSPESEFVSWVHLYERCPRCAADLEAHAQAAALAAAVEGLVLGEFPPRLIWVEELTTCPQCGAALP
jgi:hypothetical protein